MNRLQRRLLNSNKWKAKNPHMKEINMEQITTEQLQARYAEACAKLGEVTLHIELLTAQKQAYCEQLVTLRAEGDKLNEAARAQVKPEPEQDDAEGAEMIKKAQMAEGASK